MTESHHIGNCIATSYILKSQTHRSKWNFCSTEVSVACLSCLRGALKGERVVNGIELGTYDYTPHAETIIGMIIKAKLGMEPTSKEIMEIMAKLRSTINVMDAPFIAADLMGECGVGGKTTLEVCMEDVDMDMTLGY